jgi:two-component system, OmpR family, heavy metal sensor histidine kinase CusS
LKRLPIHVRLTAWYLLSLTVIITLFAVASWYAMKASMFHSIDRDLGYRMQAVVPFIESHSLSTPQDFEKTFANSSDSSIVGVFVQITDAASNVLYESDVLGSHRVPIFAAGQPDGSISRTTVNQRGWAVRVASKHITVNGTQLTVHVVEPLRDLLSSLHELTFYFVVLVSIALLLTAITGYLISRRALAPVEQIRRQADAIDHADLTARLQVQHSDDELGRLARTLNSMLSRIEAGFRSVERFTADASHELRAPLAFIITAGDVSLRRPRSREELAEVLGKLTAEARRMARLVEDLLVLARGDAQPPGINQERVDLNALLTEVTEQLEPTAAAKELELRASLPNESVHVSGVASDLRRLFLILLDNAIKYTDKGVIDTTLAVKQADVIVTVNDTGIGIEPAELPRIFDRFWRADKVRSRAEGGVGLGLSLAAQIAQRHHGTIAVDSILGKGSTFTVKLRTSDVHENRAVSENFQIHR